jgi:cystathionine beta-lyase/cystathionine gamma-synthase
MLDTARDFIRMSKAASGAPANAELKPDSKVTLAGRKPFAHHGYVNTPVYHASTLLYRSAEDYLAQLGPYHYGRRGTPTSWSATAPMDRRARSATACWLVVVSPPPTTIR